jgi:hypothetical protein
LLFFYLFFLNADDNIPFKQLPIEIELIKSGSNY